MHERSTLDTAVPLRFHVLVKLLRQLVIRLEMVLAQPTMDGDREQ